MNWKRIVSLLVALALLTAACGSDGDEDDSASDEATDTTPPADGDDGGSEDSVVGGEDEEGGSGGLLFPNAQERPPFPIMMSPLACTGASFGGIGDGPTGIDEPFVGEGYGGPMYRPGVVLATGEFDPSIAEDSGVQLVNVPLTVEAEVSGPLIDGQPTSGSVPEDVATLWWIASAENAVLLDPVNLVLALEDLNLEPVYVFTPAGGHMYGPEGAATLEDLGGIRDMVTTDGANNGSGMRVGIIDTSFDVVPVAGDATSVTGHGSFITGIVHGLVPEAAITTVDMGPAGENLEVVLPDAVIQLYGATGVFGSSTDPFHVVDSLQLAISISAAKAKDLIFDAINMSFGTYTCGDIEPPVLRSIVDSVGEKPIFAAAGNDNTDSPWWPAAFHADGSSPYAIGGLAPHDTRWVHSNFGAWVEYCDLAENVNVEPHFPDGAGTGGVVGSGDRYTWSGTSFASPIALSRFLADGDFSVEEACKVN